MKQLLAHFRRDHFPSGEGRTPLKRQESTAILIRSKIDNISLDRCNDRADWPLSTSFHDETSHRHPTRGHKTEMSHQYELADSPSDIISSIAFSPSGDRILVSTRVNDLRISLHIYFNLRSSHYSDIFQERTDTTFTLCRSAPGIKTFTSTPSHHNKMGPHTPSNIKSPAKRPY